MKTYINKDIYTIIWKECKEFFALSTPQMILLRVLMLIFIMGILLPFKFGINWLNSSLTLYYWCWFSCFIIIGPAANSIIRERRSYTLDILLTSRLSDKNIFFGKFIACLLYSYPFVAISIIIGWITVNLSNWQGHLIYYSSKLILGGTFICILSMCIIGGISFFLSLKVKETLKTIQIINTIIFFLITPGAIFYWFPKSKDLRIDYINKIDVYVNYQIILLLIILQIIVTILILSFIKGRFNRKYLLE
jgi:ABC-type transport system involved in multi-copper enzyme maturation permease subunit